MDMILPTLTRGKILSKPGRDQLFAFDEPVVRRQDVVEPARPALRVSGQDALGPCSSPSGRRRAVVVGDELDGRFAGEIGFVTRPTRFPFRSTTAMLLFRPSRDPLSMTMDL